MKCKKCGADKVPTGDILVLSDGYEIEELKCKHCKEG